MKISYFSDLHIETSEYKAVSSNADVIVLAGDIGVGETGLHWARAQFSQEIIYVLGNHEFYNTEIHACREHLQIVAKKLGIHLLDNESTIINNVEFIGTTLWTDYDLHGTPVDSQRIAADKLYDYRKIQIDVGNGVEKLKPEHTLAMHQASLKFLSKQLSEKTTSKRIIISHHAPSIRSLSKKYINHYLSPSYASHLEHLIYEFGVDIWIHGHTHHNAIFNIGRTLILSNQRGNNNDDSRRDFNHLAQIAL